ncbi:MAG: DegT/DnrJ/EryC1/StrS family aminotransferase [archaeon]|nr:DegT/DnrJ/EryC1/StrS family aminotransferase [archaeon]
MIPISKPFLEGNELKYVTEAVESNWVSSIGKYIPLFEESFASFIGSNFGVAVSNGTVALHLGLEALGIGKGDEVIVPDLTFVASPNSIIYTGAKPVFADVSKENWNIDPEAIREKITKKTKAIMPVHLYGAPCKMDEIMEIAVENDLKVIEDCAESHGAEFNGKKLGSFGDCGTFSFYGNKIMTSGEGGIVTTNNEELAEKMMLLRDHAMSKKKRYWHEIVGFNYRITNLQAALGLAQTEKINFFIERRDKIAEKYNSLLKDVKGITLQKEIPNSKNVCWLYSVLIEDEFGKSRNEVMKLLAEKGIDSRPFFYPCHTMPPYLKKESFPVSENLSLKGMNLPTFIGLKDEEIEFIADTIISLKE